MKLLASELKRSNFVSIIDEYTSEKQFAFVHKTNYMPSENCIKSIYQAGGCYEGNASIYGIDFTYKYPIADDYIHFSINCEAFDDGRYGFNNRKYAVIIPGSVEQFKNIARFSSNDVEFKGIKDISSCYVLCPESEYEKCKHNNPDVNVVSYEGEYVDGYCNLLLEKLGYNVETIILHGEFEWKNNNHYRTKSVLNKYGFEFTPYGTKYFFENRAMQQLERIKSFYDAIINISLENNINILRIIDDLQKVLSNNEIRLSSMKKLNINIDIPNVKTKNEKLNKYLTETMFINQNIETYIFVNRLLKIDETILIQNYLEFDREKESHVKK